MERIYFNIIFRPEPEGGYTAIVPTLSGCITCGKNLEEARKNAGDAINAYVASLIKHGEPVPSDNMSFVSSADVEIPLTKK